MGLVPCVLGEVPTFRARAANKSLAVSLSRHTFCPGKRVASVSKCPTIHKDDITSDTTYITISNIFSKRLCHILLLMPRKVFVGSGGITLKCLKVFHAKRESICTELKHFAPDTTSGFV